MIRITDVTLSTQQNLIVNAYDMFPSSGILFVVWRKRFCWRPNGVKGLVIISAGSWWAVPTLLSTIPCGFKDLVGWALPTATARGALWPKIEPTPVAILTCYWSGLFPVEADTNGDGNYDWDSGNLSWDDY